METAPALSVSTPEMIFSAVYCIGMVAAFIVGTRKMRHENAPLYFRLIIYAIGCAALEAVCTMVAMVASGVNDPSRTSRLVSTLAFYLFFASANWGQIDGLVDEKRAKTRKARLAAIVFPVLVAAAAPFIWKPVSDLGKIALAVFLMIELLPMALGGYFSFKHLLLPMDPLGIKKMTRPINITILITILLGLVSLLFFGDTLKGETTAVNIVRAAMLVNTFVMTFAAIRGAKIWKTLV